MDLVHEPIWRDFWYPLAFAAEIDEAPISRELLGERLVLWRVDADRIAGALDRCPHRDAALSQGWTDGGQIVCPYHGWQYADDGAVRVIPQIPTLSKFPSKFVLQSVSVALDYGVVWVCLGVPRRPIPRLPDPMAEGWRFIREFDEVWLASAPRLMENSFDPAHTVFVHRATFGDAQRPDVDTPKVERTEYGLSMYHDISVANPEFARASTGESSEMTVRRTTTSFYAPFVRVLSISYPSGRVHQIVTAATPVDNDRLRLVQWAVRNDSEAESPADDVVAFDRRVTWEDQALLEGIRQPYSETLDSSVHIRVDRSTVELRRVYQEIIAGTWCDAPLGAVVSAHDGERDEDEDVFVAEAVQPA